MVKFAYGEADFAKIRRKEAFYVDKTPFLPELERTDFGYSKLIFLRPRRFGKSLLINMMEHYYDIALANQYDDLFKGLWIYDNPTPEKSKYMVLHLNFSTVSTDGGHAEIKSSFARAVKLGIQIMVARHRDRIPELQGLPDRLEKENDPAEIMSILLGTMAGRQNESLYVMIDEYDSFANALLSKEAKGIYHNVTESTGFVRNFYRTLKSGSETSAISRVFITGATPVLLDDLVSGFNVVINISNKWRFNELAGFTHADVERAVDALLRDRPDLAALEGISDRATLLTTLTHYYDGYRFSTRPQDQRMFNSNLVVYFLKELADGGEYPRQMLDPNGRTDYQKLHSLWANVGPEAETRREIIEQILGEGHVRSELVDRFGSKGTPTHSQFVSLLYYTGMLTLSPEAQMGNRYRFEVPNRVIRNLGWEHYALLLQDLRNLPLMDQPVVTALEAMIERNDLEPFLEALRTKILPTLSNKDLRKHDEKAMKMLLIGAMVTSNLFYVFSEKEFAQGYNDLFVTPSPRISSAQTAWMFELKYLTAKEAGNEVATVRAAEEQLRKYLSDNTLVDALSRGKELKVGTLVFIGAKVVNWRVLGWGESEYEKATTQAKTPKRVAAKKTAAKRGRRDV